MTSLHRWTLAGAILLAMLPGLATAWEPVELAGSVAVPAKGIDPAHASVHVRLMDVSRPGAPAALLAEQTIDSPKVLPVAFVLVYDKKALKAEGSYQIEAEVFQDGQLTLLTARPVPVVKDVPLSAPVVVDWLDKAHPVP